MDTRDWAERKEEPWTEPLARTPREELFEVRDALEAKARAIMASKNADYSTAADPFRNFRMFGLLGILVRMSDKLARLRGFVENGAFQVSDELLEDTLCDLINYAHLFHAMERDGHEKKA